MEMYSTIPPLCKDAAQFLFSTLHLLLTRIIPLIAMLLGSLLLHLLHVTASFLFTKPSQSARRRLSSLKQRRPPVVLQSRDIAEAHDSYAFYEDALQDAVNTDEGADYATNEECYEDCQNDDDRWTMVGYRHGDIMEKEEMGDENDVLQESSADENDLRKEVGDYHENLGDSLQKVGANVNKEGDETDDLLKKMGDDTDDLLQGMGSTHGERGETKPLISHSSDFPADLPRSLDNVIMAAAVNNHGAEPEGSNNVRTRPLVPTFSSVAAAVQESVASTQQPLVERRRQQQERAGDGAGPRRTSSYDKFVAKFKEHFMLDGRS